MTTPLHEATDLAAARAEMKHGGYQHGDNDPEATRALLVDKAIRDRAFPPIGEVETGQAMCAGWGVRRPGVAVDLGGDAVTVTFSSGPCDSTYTSRDGTRTHQCALEAGHPGIHRDRRQKLEGFHWPDKYADKKPTTVRDDVAAVTT